MRITDFNQIPIDNIRSNSILQYVGSNPQNVGYVYCGPAFRYTQVLLAQACAKYGKKLHVYTCRLHYDNTLDKLKQYKSVILHDEYTSLKEALVDANKLVSSSIPMWQDQHIPIMARHLHVPNMKVCWVPFGTGTVLTALLQANPTTIFKCVDMHIHPGLNQTKFPDDYTRISTIPFQSIPIFTIPYYTHYNHRIWYYASTKGKKGDHIMV